MLCIARVVDADAGIDPGRLERGMAEHLLELADRRAVTQHVRAHLWRELCVGTGLSMPARFACLCTTWATACGSMSMPVPRRLKEEVLLAPGIDPFGTDARESAES